MQFPFKHLYPGKNVGRCSQWRGYRTWVIGHISNLRIKALRANASIERKNFGEEFINGYYSRHSYK